MATRPTRPTPPAPTGDTPRLPPRPPHPPHDDDRPDDYPVQTVIVELRVVVPVPPPSK
jgi:hypothetical protein